MPTSKTVNIGQIKTSINFLKRGRIALRLQFGAKWENLKKFKFFEEKKVTVIVTFWRYIEKLNDIFPLSYKEDIARYYLCFQRD